MGILDFFNTENYRRKKLDKKLKNANLHINREVHTQQLEFHDKMKNIRKESKQLDKEISKVVATSKRLQDLLVTEITYQATGHK